jgi:hypothetical protein
MIGYMVSDGKFLGALVILLIIIFGFVFFMALAARSFY